MNVYIPQILLVSKLLLDLYLSVKLFQRINPIVLHGSKRKVKQIWEWETEVRDCKYKTGIMGFSDGHEAQKIWAIPCALLV